MPHSNESSSPSALDAVDRILEDWATTRPDLEVGVIAIVQRIRRLQSRFEDALEENFTAHDLTGTGYGVLSVLIRRGEPHEVAQRDLPELLQRTPGTVSLRLDKMEQQGLIERVADPGDRRSAVIRLTEAGRARFNETTPAHLAIQDRMLAALAPIERDELARLLRKLTISLDDARPPDCPTRLAGLDLAPAHEARALQVQLGVPERTGLLVRSVEGGSSAATAGLQNGDLLVALGDAELRSIADLAEALATHKEVALTVRRGQRNRSVPLVSAEG